jgi:Uma2 family endonuclease
MVTAEQLSALTRDAFERMAALPQHRDRRLEFIDGAVIDMVSSDVSSRLALRLGGIIDAYATAHTLGYVTGADGGYRIGADDMIPDCAFVSRQRREKPLGEAYATVVPDLVVEVKSPSDTHTALVAKALKYLEAGVSMVLVVLPERRRVEAFTADDIATYGVGDMVDLNVVLPGLTVALDALFAGLE